MDLPGHNQVLYKTVRTKFSRYKDLSGLVFGKLTVLSLSHIQKHSYWKCRCDCGKETVVLGSSLTNGNTRSCGCLVSDVNSTHKQTNTPTWKSWYAMRHRCKNKNVGNYHLYGGRGISVCKEWESFENFLRDMGERPNGTSLDRINPEGNYEKSNCRWATIKEQNRNKRSIKLYTYKGDTMPLSALCEKYDVNFSRVSQRIFKCKWSIEKAIEQPVNTVKITNRKTP